ncbi:GlxA family transcriptional regulator [Marinobacterium aestuariivivens]|uniref:GlxA family transcriptional regulator n=1 Tax=Marinobacterium aestuariivivens TaxID=1698799 RepID=A0ABW2A3E9_9GAMM
MDASPIRIGILLYPGCMKSAVYGLEEMLSLANRVCAEQGRDERFDIRLCETPSTDEASYNAIVVPPCVDGDYYRAPSPALQAWIRHCFDEGSLLCSACAGAFILAATGLIEGRPVTTHWNLADAFACQYPGVRLRSEENLIDDGDLLSAGGLMSWMDLGLELVARFSTPAVMHALGALLIVDTARREQRYYRRFAPRLDHGDRAIAKAQRLLQKEYRHALTVPALAAHCHLTERTFQRRFVRATGLKPLQYLQRLRIQKACERIESSLDTFGAIAWDVGYEDLSAFRKMFVRVTGLTPSAFRKRFYRA